MDLPSEVRRLWPPGFRLVLADPARLSTMRSPAGRSTTRATGFPLEAPHPFSIRKLQAGDTNQMTPLQHGDPPHGGTTPEQTKRAGAPPNPEEAQIPR